MSNNGTTSGTTPNTTTTTGRFRTVPSPLILSKSSSSFTSFFATGNNLNNASASSSPATTPSKPKSRSAIYPISIPPPSYNINASSSSSTSNSPIPWPSGAAAVGVAPSQSVTQPAPPQRHNHASSSTSSSTRRMRNMSTGGSSSVLGYSTSATPPLILRGGGGLGTSGVGSGMVADSSIGGGNNGSPSPYLLTVVPPMHLPHDPPHPRTSAAASGYGPVEHFRRGTLIPLYPELSSQLAAIAREYSLPSTGGIVLYLLSKSDPTSSTPHPLAGEGGPRISEEAWRVLWAGLFNLDEEEEEEELEELEERYYANGRESFEVESGDETDPEEEFDAPPVPPIPLSHQTSDSSTPSSPSSITLPSTTLTNGVANGIPQLQPEGDYETLLSGTEVEDQDGEPSFSSDAETSYSSRKPRQSSGASSTPSSSIPPRSSLPSSVSPSLNRSTGGAGGGLQLRTSTSQRGTLLSNSSRLHNSSAPPTPGGASSTSSLQNSRSRSYQSLYNSANRPPQPPSRASNRSRSRRAAPTPSAFTSSSSRRSRTLGPLGSGANVVVGKVEFDIDWRRGGNRGKWYEGWVEGARSSGARSPAEQQQQPPLSAVGSERDFSGGRRERELSLPRMIREISSGGGNSARSREVLERVEGGQGDDDDTEEIASPHQSSNWSSEVDSRSSPFALMHASGINGGDETLVGVDSHQGPRYGSPDLTNPFSTRSSLASSISPAPTAPLRQALSGSSSPVRSLSPTASRVSPVNHTYPSPPLNNASQQEFSSPASEATTTSSSNLHAPFDPYPPSSVTTPTRPDLRLRSASGHTHPAKVDSVASMGTFSPDQLLLTNQLPSSTSDYSIAAVQGHVDGHRQSPSFASASGYSIAAVQGHAYQSEADVGESPRSKMDHSTRSSLDLDSKPLSPVMESFPPSGSPSFAGGSQFFEHLDNGLEEGYAEEVDEGAQEAGYVMLNEDDDDEAEEDATLGTLPSPTMIIPDNLNGSDPLDSIFPADESAWQSGPSHSFEPPSGLGISHAVVPEAKLVDEGVLAPEDDVKDVTEMLKAARSAPSNQLLASPIRLSSSPTAANETGTFPSNHLPSSSEGDEDEENLASRFSASAEGGSSIPASPEISSRRAIQRNGVADWGVPPSFESPEQIVDRASAEHPLHQEVRQSTLGLEENLDNLEKALAELSPRTAMSRLGSSQSHSTKSSSSPRLSDDVPTPKPYSPFIPVSTTLSYPSSPLSTSTASQREPLLSSASYNDPSPNLTPRIPTPTTPSHSPKPPSSPQLQSATLPPSSPVLPEFSEPNVPTTPRQPSVGPIDSTETPAARPPLRTPRGSSMRKPSISALPLAPGIPSPSVSRTEEVDSEESTRLVFPVPPARTGSTSPSLTVLPTPSDAAQTPTASSPSSSYFPPIAPPLPLPSPSTVKDRSDSESSAKSSTSPGRLKGFRTGKSWTLKTEKTGKSDGGPKSPDLGSPSKGFFKAPTFGKLNGLFQKKGSLDSASTPSPTSPTEVTAIYNPLTAEPLSSSPPRVAPPRPARDFDAPQFVIPPRATSLGLPTLETDPVLLPTPQSPSPQPKSPTTTAALEVTEESTMATSPRSEYTPRSPGLSSGLPYPASAPSTPSTWGTGSRGTPRLQNGKSPREGKGRLSADIDQLLASMGTMDFGDEEPHTPVRDTFANGITSSNGVSNDPSTLSPPTSPGAGLAALGNIMLTNSLSRDP